MSLSKESFYVKHKKDEDVTSVWSHFLVDKMGSSAKCKRCSAILKTLGGSTKGLHTHLFSKHSIKIDSAKASSSTSQNNEGPPGPPSKRKMTDYFVKSESDTLDDVLARMTALDGFPFSVFVTSKDLRSLLLSKGYSDLPKSASTIRNRVLDYNVKIKKQITAELSTLTKEGQRFSLSFDEWTSTSNKRYNLNIHSINKKWNLGLIRIDKSLTAETCVHNLKKRLLDFHISLDTDIVAIVTDGPNVMLKVGKLVNAEHQVCFAHGIHLAVCDLLYKKTPVNETATTASDDFDDSDDDEELDSGLVIETGNGRDLTYDDRNINELIKKVRKVVLIFKRASLKNDTILQKYVKKEHGRELNLLLDCKTRWNSLFTMLERFDLLKTSVKKALIDLNNPVPFEESDFQLISEIIKVLAPVKLSVEALCRSDANLCTADATLKFLFQELRDNDSILASKLKTHLLNRLKDRRRSELSGVLNYLQNPHTEKTELETNCDLKELFSSPSKMTIKKTDKIICFFVSCFLLAGKIENSDNEENDMNIEPTQTTSKTDSTLKEKLQNEIEKSMKIINPEAFKETDLSKIIKQEMNLFEASSTRGHNLEKAYKNLLTIPPTSIEPERAFSAASYLCNKLRSMLSDETLDALLFLRFYFRGLNK